MKERNEKKRYCNPSRQPQTYGLRCYTIPHFESTEKEKTSKERKGKKRQKQNFYAKTPSNDVSPSEGDDMKQKERNSSHHDSWLVSSVSALLLLAAASCGGNKLNKQPDAIAPACQAGKAACWCASPRSCGTGASPVGALLVLS